MGNVADVPNCGFAINMLANVHFKEDFRSSLGTNKLLQSFLFWCLLFCLGYQDNFFADFSNHSSCPNSASTTDRLLFEGVCLLR
jgi:hypothetical protein